VQEVQYTNPPKAKVRLWHLTFLAVAHGHAHAWPMRTRRLAYSVGEEVFGDLDIRQHGACVHRCARCAKWPPSWHRRRMHVQNHISNGVVIEVAGGAVEHHRTRQNVTCQRRVAKRV